ncbi:MAG: Uma2 family endonuclease [Acidobacteria bacterium]|nr:Uma2 family endonuclease [Acidobacteriota bacterium]
MATSAAVITVREFQEMQVPKDRRVELVAGEVVELGNAKARHETVKSRIHRMLVLFDPRGKLGDVFSDTMYELGPQDTRVPDVSFRLKEQMQMPVPDAYFTAPALAVEVVSSEAADELMSRVEDHFRGGSRTVWVVYPERRAVMVHEPDGNARLLHESDTLRVSWLTGFEAPVADLFDGL